MRLQLVDVSGQCRMQLTLDTSKARSAATKPVKLQRSPASGGAAARTRYNSVAWRQALHVSIMHDCKLPATDQEMLHTTAVYHTLTPNVNM